jgi:hypothetical protein
VQFLSNSGHLLRRYGENNEDMFLLTKFSYADNLAEKDNKCCAEYEKNLEFTVYAVVQPNQWVS